MYSAGIMKEQIDSIENRIDSMTSDALTAFRNKFVTNFRNTITTLSYMPRLCCGALLAERNLFEETRTKLTMLITDTTTTFGRIAEDSSFSFLSRLKCWQKLRRASKRP